MPVSSPSEKEKPVRTVIGAAARGEHSNGIHCDPEPPDHASGMFKMVWANTAQRTHPRGDRPENAFRNDLCKTRHPAFQPHTSVKEFPPLKAISCTWR
jgi:hypothetical protein